MTGDDFTVPDDLTELLRPAESTERLVHPRPPRRWFLIVGLPRWVHLI